MPTTPESTNKEEHAMDTENLRKLFACPIHGLVPSRAGSETPGARWAPPMPTDPTPEHVHPTEREMIQMAEVSFNTQTQNSRGEWAPAIPEPLFFGFFHQPRCGCGKTFRSRRRYREHFALVHILGLS